MFKAFSYVFAFVIICLIGLFGWLSFSDMPVERQTVEQTVQLPGQS